MQQKSCLGLVLSEFKRNNKIVNYTSINASLYKYIKLLFMYLFYTLEDLHR